MRFSFLLFSVPLCLCGEKKENIHFQHLHLQISSILKRLSDAKVNEVVVIQFGTTIQGESEI